jgi:hypothetical protein
LVNLDSFLTKKNSFFSFYQQKNYIASRKMSFSKHLSWMNIIFHRRISSARLDSIHLSQMNSKMDFFGCATKELSSEQEVPRFTTSHQPEDDGGDDDEKRKARRKKWLSTFADIREKSIP